MLIILTGVCCSGKDTIKKEMIKQKIAKPIVTITTRPKRSKEIDGKDYRFVSDMEFLEMVQNGEFAEFKDYAVADGSVWMYGSPAKEIEKAEDEDRVIILTPQGVRDLKTSFSHIPMKVFYVYANYKTVQERLEQRGDDKFESQRRINKDREDFKGWENEVDKIIYNNLDDNIKDVVDKIRGYL